MSAPMPDYGRDGLVGIGTPQANPTVEAELRLLLPLRCAMVVTRLTSAAETPVERLRAYLLNLEQTLTQYDTLRPRIYGFGCTASAYLLPAHKVEAIVKHAEDRFGYPIVLASAAIKRELQARGAERIAIATPYPRALADPAAEFWSAEGFEVRHLARVEIEGSDTRGIYALSSESARPAVAALDADGDFDAIVLSGTGMPSLALVRDGAALPILSSNLCLANCLCADLGLPRPDLHEVRQRLSLAV